MSININNKPPRVVQVVRGATPDEIRDWANLELAAETDPSIEPPGKIPIEGILFYALLASGSIKTKISISTRNKKRKAKK